LIGYRSPHVVSDVQGYLTSWETEKAIWDTILFDGESPVDPLETSLVVTEPVLDLPILQDSYDQIIFEEYEFDSYHRATGNVDIHRV